MNKMGFTEELQQWQTIRTAGSCKEKGKIKIFAEFPDPEHLLDSAYEFLKRMTVPEMILRTVREKTNTFEEYTITLSPGTCTIAANDTEGIRRGIYKTAEYLREYIPEEFPVLTKRFTPQFKTRISRYRFHLPGNDGERAHELDDQADFYPEPFLDRFASEGINAVWFNLNHNLSWLTLTKWNPDRAEEKQKIYAKMQKIVDRCRRYGIKLFPYFVVPTTRKYNDPLFEKYPDLAGPLLYGMPMFCPAFSGYQYWYDTFHQLFSAVRNLGGFLMIVEGEGASLCPILESHGEVPCRKKCGLTGGEVYAKHFEAAYRGIKDASPDSELIAWHYLPFATKLSPYHEEAVAKSPEGIIFQFNAESGSTPVQLGKPRRIGDYWQCITEPAPNYREFASFTKKYNRRLSAKIQVGTSHEVGSIPYVTVPLLTYRKFKNLKALGTTDLMQCWGNGGTPGTMNFAAGRLSFTDFSNVSEQDFLKDLAVTLWGRKSADKAAEAWTILSEAYQQFYPYSNMMQYFGPIADGIKWRLFAYPSNETLLPTWTISRESSGDNLCECFDNHSHEELVLLLEKLADEWKRGLALFREILADQPERDDLAREVVRIEALGIQFASASRILKFYLLRRQVFAAPEGRFPLLDTMKEIVLQEKSARERMLELLEIDPSLGYNPEACGWKYDDESILRGLGTIPSTLEDLEKIRNGELAYPKPEVPYFTDGTEIKLDFMTWSAKQEGDHIRISVACPNTDPVLDELFFAFDDDGIHHPIHAHFDCSGRIFIKPEGCEIRISSDETGWNAEILLPFHCIPGWGTPGCRFNLVRLIRDYEKVYSWPGLFKGPVVTTLGLAFYNPKDMAYFLPERKEQ